MIRRFIFTGIIIMACMSGYAQKNVNQLFDEYSKFKESTNVNIGKIGMFFAGFFTDTYGVNGVEVLDLGQATESVKQRFSEEVKAIRDSKFETMVSSNENGERVKVLVKIKDDIINELVVLTTGNSSVMVRIKGNIKRSDIEKLINEHKK